MVKTITEEGFQLIAEILNYLQDEDKHYLEFLADQAPEDLDYFQSLNTEERIDYAIDNNLECHIYITILKLRVELGI